MSTFMDTSALIAVFDAAERNHKQADVVWRHLLESEDDIVVTNYVMVETCAVAQRRIGIEAIRAIEERAVPLLHIVWIDKQDHHAGMQAVLAANRRGLSLVDCTSFGVMRRLGIRAAFTFDEHFKEQGFTCLP